MGLFRGLTNTYKKSEAAVVVQNLLEYINRGGGMLEGQPAKLANELVGSVWDSKPDLFGGRFGQRPHKVSVASAALACGLATGQRRYPNDWMWFGVALGNLLSDIKVNGRLYPFNSLDQQLLEESVQRFEAHASEIRQVTQPAIPSIPGEALESASSFMDLSMQLVSFELGDPSEIAMRQRAAACAFGALDWYCQAKGYKLDHATWVAGSAAFMTKYFCYGEEDIGDRLDADLITKKVTEVGLGGGAPGVGKILGAAAMKAWIVNSDAQAPLVCSKYINDVGT